MSSCPIDHTKADVLKKLDSQASFLPEDIFQGLKASLEQIELQEKLNDIFHLLKKYDLASKEEQANREEKMRVYI